MTEEEVYKPLLDNIYGCHVLWPKPISYYGKKDVWEYIEEVEEVLRDLNEELDDL